MNKNMQSLDLSGYGTCCGGEFYKVDISGKGNIDGDIKCSKFDGSGLAKVKGNVLSEEFSTSGMSKVIGNINSKEVDISGTLKVEGNLHSNKLGVSGVATIEGKVFSNEINSEGLLKVNGDIEGEVIDIYGTLQNKGFINCEELNIRLCGECRCNDIGASTINVEAEESTSSFLNIFTPKKFKNKKLIANEIEGDNIYLENCEVKVVRGKNIKIGLKCNIGIIEYSENLEINENSKAKEINKI